MNIPLFLAIFFVSYLYHGMGITVGYHRMLAHKSLTTPKWLEYFFVSGAYLCMQGSPIHWVATHRYHHKHTDEPADPHSPHHGIWHAFFGWALDHEDLSDFRTRMLLCKDLCRDSNYGLLHGNNVAHRWSLCLMFSILFRVAIFALFGWVALAANLCASVLVFISPLLINTICHLPKFGARPHNIDDKSANVWWLALSSLGEAWHNNHHAAPFSARHGFEWNQLDPSFALIKLLETVGLAKDVRVYDAKKAPILAHAVQTSAANEVKVVNTVAPNSKELVLSTKEGRPPLRAVETKTLSICRKLVLK